MLPLEHYRFSSCENVAEIQEIPEKEKYYETKRNLKIASRESLIVIWAGKKSSKKNVWNNLWQSSDIVEQETIVWSDSSILSNWQDQEDVEEKEEENTETTSSQKRLFSCSVYGSMILTLNNRCEVRGERVEWVELLQCHVWHRRENTCATRHAASYTCFRWILSPTVRDVLVWQR